MGYCFVSVEKCKTKADLVRKYEHNYRTEPVPNADPELFHLNEELVSLNGKTYLDAFNEKLSQLDLYKDGRPPRKDAVLGLEVVMTFSREDREHVDLEEWKKDNVEWLRKTFNANSEKYGDNVISVMYHADENGNVHCHAMVIPIDDKGHLNASYYTGGRAKMIQMQNTYGDAMAKHGLKRGLRGSPAKHTDIKKFYAALNQEVVKTLPQPEPKEKAEAYYERVNPDYQKIVLQNFGLKKRIERLELENGKKDLDERIAFEKEKASLQTERESLERQRTSFQELFGNEKQVAAKLTTLEHLDNGLKIFPDRNFAEETLANMQILIEYDKEEKERRKRIEKESARGEGAGEEE